MDANMGRRMTSEPFLWRMKAIHWPEVETKEYSRDAGMEEAQRVHICGSLDAYCLG